MKCIDCVTKESILPNSLISFSDIIKSESKTILKNWPFTHELSENGMVSLRNMDIKEEVNKYFKDLRACINDCIDKLNCKMLSKAEDVLNLNERVLEEYNKLSQKE